LRFFDFDVEPGKTYRYRIFLILFNPNFGLDAKVLKNVADGNRDNWYIGHDKEQRDDQKMIISAEPKVDNMPWSDPTPLVTIPSDQGILAGKVETPHNAVEPQGELYSVRWLPENGERAFTVIEKVKRAQMIDVLPRASENGPRNVKVDFTTNDCVIDMRGGESLSLHDKDKELTAPGQVLCMDHDGRLVIHDELDDADMIAKFREKPSSSPAPRSRPTEGGQPTRRSGSAKPEKGIDFQP
jgi:hypothetical protein